MSVYKRNKQFMLQNKNFNLKQKPAPPVIYWDSNNDTQKT